MCIPKYNDQAITHIIRYERFDKRVNFSPGHAGEVTPRAILSTLQGMAGPLPEE